MGSKNQNKDVYANSVIKPSGEITPNERLIDLTSAADQAEVVLGVCEGEIEGLEKGPKSFYIADTKLQNEAGEYNFEDFALEVYHGSGSDEEQLDYFLGGASRSTNVNVVLAKGEPVTRELERGDIDFIEVRIAINSLFQTNYSKKSTSVGASIVEVMIEYKNIMETEWHNVTGKAGQGVLFRGYVTSTIAQDIRIQVERKTTPYEIRVTKLSDDLDKSSDRANAVTFESFQDGVFTATSFPNTALAHIKFQYSNQLSSVPSFYGIYKLMKIRVPSNYDPETHTYNGEWDGSFKRAWSDNPAWCLYDFVMNDRYGMNAFNPVSLDKWDCYEAGKWCDELVSDGRGGKEPRFTCNLCQTESTNGREFAVFLAGLFNAALVEESTGYLRLFCDRDNDAVFLFTPENITSDGFSYSFTSPENRYNDIKVSFTNPDLSWESDTRRVYNQEDIDKNGRITYDFIAVGCIREGEAMRRAYYKLNSSLTEKTTVTFSTNRQAQSLSNFDVILVADPILGFSIPGRIQSLSADRKTIYLRDSVYLEAGIPYKIQFNVPSGLYENEISPLSGSGNLKELKLKEPLSEEVPEFGVFTISGSAKTGTPKPFRIATINESDGDPDSYTITAVEINRNKWAAGDNLEIATTDDYSGIPSMADIPHLLDAKFYTSYDRVNLQNNLAITPVYDESYPFYSDNIIVYSKSTDMGVNWTKQTVTNNRIIVDHPAGEYQFIVLPVSTSGITPSFNTAPIFTYVIPETNLFPSNVKNLTAERSVSGVQLTWDPVEDIDLDCYEVRDGALWESGEVVVTNLTANTAFVTIQDGATHSYMVCAKNFQGNYSIVPAYISSSVIAPDDVPYFYCTTSQDRVRFDWTQVPGVDVQYEIRQGSNWSTGISVAKVKGNNTTVLMPGSTGEGLTYAIKAISSAGLYSNSPRYAHPDVELFSNRNVIIKVDGLTDCGDDVINYGFEPIEYVEHAMAMSAEFSRSEYYFPVVLNKETYARNWLDTEAFSFGDRLKWGDLKFRWSSTDAHINWMNGQEINDADGEIGLVIFKYREPTDYPYLYGFPMNNYAQDIRNERYPFIETNVTYGKARVTDGLVLTPTTKLGYKDLPVPPEFNIMFKMKVDNTCDSYTNLLTLVGPKNTYVKMYLYQGNLYAKFSDHRDIIIPAKWSETLDFLTFGISQSSTQRLLYFFADYGNFESYQEIEANPVGSFDQLYINRNLGEFLNENVR